MKKLAKRVIGLTLAAVISVTSFDVTAFAAEPNIQLENNVDVTTINPTGGIDMSMPSPDGTPDGGNGGGTSGNAGDVVIDNPDTPDITTDISPENPGDDTANNGNGTDDAADITTGDNNTDGNTDSEINAEEDMVENDTLVTELTDKSEEPLLLSGSPIRNDESFGVTFWEYSADGSYGSGNDYLYFDSLQDVIAEAENRSKTKNIGLDITVLQDAQLDADVVFPSWLVSLSIRGNTYEGKFYALDLNGHTINFEKSDNQKYGFESQLSNLCLISSTSKGYIQTDAYMSIRCYEGFAARIENVDILSSNESLNMGVDPSFGTSQMGPDDFSGFIFNNSTVTAERISLNAMCVSDSATETSFYIPYTVLFDKVETGRLQLNEKVSASVERLTQKGGTFTGTGTGGCTVDMGYDSGPLFLNGTADIALIRNRDSWEKGYSKNKIYINKGANVAIGSIKASSDSAFYDLLFSIGQYENKLTGVYSSNNTLLSVTDTDGTLTHRYVLSDITERTKLYSAKSNEFVEFEYAETALPSDSTSNYTYVMQDGTGVFACSHAITVSPYPNFDMSSVSEKSFSTWAEAKKYIESFANAGASYLIKVYDDIDLGTPLTLPAYTNGIRIVGAKTVSAENPSSQNAQSGTVIRATGNLLLSTNLTLENINLEVGSISSTSAGGKNLSLNESTVTVKVNTDIKGNLIMKSSTLDGDGKINVTNIITNSSDNNIYYGKNSQLDLLTVSGDIYSEEIFSEAYAYVKTGHDDYTIVDFLSDIPADKSYETVKKSAISVRQKRIEFTGNYVGDSATTTASPLVNVTKALAGYFVVARTDSDGNVTVTSTTHKSSDGKTIRYGGISGAPVILQMSADDSIYEYESGFNTINEAFAEIDKLASPNRYYKIILNGAAADTNETASTTQPVFSKPTDTLKFPTRLKKLYITTSQADSDSIPNADKLELEFLSGITIKSDVEISNIAFKPARQGAIGLGNYKLTLNNCEFVPVTVNGIQRPAFNAVNGSGVNNTSTLSIQNLYEESFTIGGAVNGVACLQLENTIIDVNGNINIGNLVHNSEVTTAELYGLATVSKGTVKYEDETTTEPITIPGAITRIVPGITISGKVSPSQPVGLGLLERVRGTDGIDRFEPIPFYSEGELYPNSAVTCDTRYYRRNNGTFQLAKAVNSNPGSFYLATRNNLSGNTGYLTKISQYITYVNGDESAAEVTLKYSNGDENVSILFSTFKDAVAEINNLRTKRDYTIKINEGNFSDKYYEKTVAPSVITMPTASYISHLTIEGDPAGTAELLYTGGITLTSNTTLKNVYFRQYFRNPSQTEISGYTFIGGRYYPTDELYNSYPRSIPTVNLGNYTLNIQGNVTCNTPLRITGGAKSVLNLSDNASFVTETNGYTESTALEYVTGTISSAADSASSVIAGTLNAGTVINRGNLSVLSTKTSYEVVYRPNAAFSVTNYEGDSDSTLYVDGSINAVNIKMHLYTGIITGLDDINASIEALTAFNVTGLISMPEGLVPVLFITHKNRVETPEKNIYGTPYLNISGKMDERGANPITVAVKYAYNDPQAEYSDYAELFGAMTAATKNASYLLTARYLTPFFIRPYKENVGYRTAFSDSNTDGYLLLKTGNNFYVYYGEDVAAAVYANTSSGSLYSSTEDLHPPMGYYLTINDAVKAIDAQNKPSSDYLIKLYKSLGTLNDDDTITPVATVPVPSKARSVTYTGENIYFSSSITSKVPVRFDGINVIATGSGSFKGADLSLVNGASITVNKGEIVAGNITHDGSGVSLSYGTNLIGKGNLTVKGEITGDGNTVLDLNVRLNENKLFESYVIPATVSGTKAPIADAKKLAAFEKAATGSVNVTILDAEGEHFTSPDYSDYMTVKASKGLYVKSKPVNYDLTVYVRKLSSDSDDAEYIGYESACLDLNQAVTEINNLNDPTQYYTIELPVRLEDTIATDTGKRGGFYMPGDNKSAGVKVMPREPGTRPYVYFTGNITLFGNVTLEDLNIQCYRNDTIYNNYMITLKQNSNKKLDAAYRTSELIVDNTYLDKEAVEVSNISNGHVNAISGVKGISNVVFRNVGDLTVLSGINNTSAVIEESAVTVKGNSKIDVIKFVNNGSTSTLECLGDMTISTVDVSDYVFNDYSEPHIKAGLNKYDKSRLTISDAVVGGKVCIELDTTGKNYTADQIDALSFAVSPKESADKFVRYGYTDNPDIISYKDLNNYVYCADLKEMAVSLTDSNGNMTYAKTYYDAVKIIDNINDKTRDYEIYLLDRRVYSDLPSDSNEIKTGANGKFGSFIMPKAGRCQSLKISGKLNESMKPVNALLFEGTMNLTADLTLENIYVAAVTVSNKWVSGSLVQEYNNLHYINTNLSNYNLKVMPLTSIYGNEGYEHDMMFASISGNGTATIINKNFGVANTVRCGKLELINNSIYGDTLKCNISGASQINELYLEGAVDLSAGDVNVGKLSFETKVKDTTVYRPEFRSMKKVTIGSVEGKTTGDTAQVIDLTYIISPLTRTAPSLTINGSVVNAHVILHPMFMDTDGTYKYVKDYKLSDMTVTDGDFGTGKSFINIPKCGSDAFNIDNVSIGSLNLVKYNGGLYISSTIPSIIVEGYKTTDFNRSDITFSSRFLTWDQAIADINKVSSNVDGKDNSSIKIILESDLGGKQLKGSKSPLASVAMPSKVKKLWLTSAGDITLDSQKTIHSKAATWTMKSDTLITGVLYRNYDAKRTTVDWVFDEETFTSSPVDVYYKNNLYTLDIGGFNVEMDIYRPRYDANMYNIYAGSGNSGGYYDKCGRVSVKGTAKSSLTYHNNVSNFQNGSAMNHDYIFNSGNAPYDNMFDSITGVGTVHLKKVKDGAYDTWYTTVITNVGTLIADERVAIHSYKPITVKNAIVRDCGVIASTADVTISGTLTMGTGFVSAGELGFCADYLKTSINNNVNGGKLTLNNIVLERDGNMLIARQDTRGNSKMSISGTVTKTADYTENYTRDSYDRPIQVGILYNASVKPRYQATVNFVPIYDGMILFTAPKADASMFSPVYFDETTTFLNNDRMCNGSDDYGLVKIKNNVVYTNITQ